MNAGDLPPTLVLCMVAIIALWVGIIAARSTIGGDAAAQRADDQR